MAKIVELCGSPGVGKTTIYNKIVSKWNKSANWAPAHCLYPSASIDYSNIKNCITTLAKRLNGQHDRIAMQNAGDRFMEAYPDYINCVWQHIVESKDQFNGADQRFEKAAYVHKMIQKIQTLLELDDSTVALLDEGLINGISYALYSSVNVDDQQEEIKELLNLMPLPDAVVYIETNIKENVKRIMTRKKVINSFKELDEDGLKTVTVTLRNRRKIATKLLSDRGVPIYYVNSSDSIDTNASKIISFLEDFS